MNTVLMMIAKLIWGFDVMKKAELDTSIETGFHGGLVIGYEPFEVDFMVRSEKHREASKGLGDDEGVAGVRTSHERVMDSR